MLFVLAVLLLFTSCSEVLCASSKQTKDNADEYDFVLVNNSGFTFRNIWMSHPGKPNWTEQDKIKLENRKLENGESMKINLPAYRSVSYLPKRKARYYDIRVELPVEVKNNKFWQWRKLDFSKVYKIEITRKDAGLHLTYFTR